MIYLIEEADNEKHLKALRPELGEEVALLDLKGKAKVYSVTSIKPFRMEFKKTIEADEPTIKTTLYLAPPSDSALEQAVEQATEVGYDRICFFRSERVQIPKSKALPLPRLRRVVQSSCKQCGRLWAPHIDEKFFTFSEALQDCSSSLVICADENAARQSWGSLEGHLPRDGRHLAIFIGPEGGWSEAERLALHSKARTFSLGPHVLRVPTAVVSAYALSWKELQS